MQLQPLKINAAASTYAPLEIVGEVYDDRHTNNDGNDGIVYNQRFTGKTSDEVKAIVELWVFVSGAAL